MALAHREMGPPAVASLIAHLVFRGLLLWGLGRFKGDVRVT
jgi:hypothetical protein